MRSWLGVAAPFVLFGLIYAQTGEQMPDHRKLGGDRIMHDHPPIVVTINPEARASVVLAGALPAPAPCGTAADFRVRIVNQGFITSRLEAEIVGDAHGNVSLDFEPTPLKGSPEELRNLRIILAKPGTWDVTIAFKLHNETPDLGGRDRIHFLMHCVQVH